MVPPNGLFMMENTIEMDDLGVPIYSETSMFNRLQEVFYTEPPNDLLRLRQPYLVALHRVEIRAMLDYLLDHHIYGEGSCVLPTYPTPVDTGLALT